MKRILDRIKRYLRMRQLEREIRRHCAKHGFVCHCQYCNHPLFNTPHVYKDRWGNEILTCYEYRCPSCEMPSTFIFDLAPVPLLIDHIGPPDGQG